MRNQDMVAEFHGKHGVGPTLEGGLKHLRSQMFTEEAEEFVEALWYESAESALKEACDVMYTLYGWADLLGYDLDAAFRQVHLSNMSKDVDPANSGKVRKGDNYVAPDLSRMV